ncbi:phage protease [Klebsiella michiganensis]|uniref:phage protease n=1 Tax=Klebsiella michiganensis TaxID=1134687 RepID=UPI002598AAE1|nr:phage protease [Klebsiella michiganensis]MDM4471363.1 phage protease [Klebsiella michiganensis]
MKTRIASLSLVINLANKNEIQLFPAGYFRAMDGRPEECPDGWFIDVDIATALIAAADERTTPYVLDYEHQTLRAKKNGQPAPASGWFKTLEWREGEGLFATGVDWTEVAAAYIDKKEYRFISPVFLYDTDGRVRTLLHAALTNTPALDDMDEVLLAAASLIASTTYEDTTMDELLEQLRWFLGLPLSATKEDVLAELQKLINKIKAADSEAAAGLAWINGLEASVAALTSQVETPDPALWVSVDIMNQAIEQARASGDEQIAQLTLQQSSELIQAALSDGRLLPAQKGWAEALAKSSPDKLREHLAKQTRIAALTTTQTGGKPPAGLPSRTVDEPDGELNPAALSVMGLDPKDFNEGNSNV